MNWDEREAAQIVAAAVAEEVRRFLESIDRVSIYDAIREGVREAMLARTEVLPEDSSAWDEPDV